MWVPSDQLKTNYIRMKRVLLLSLTLVAVIFTGCNQSAKNKEVVKKKYLAHTRVKRFIC
jgi:PBP1b-binding outer membrane lipoprotein LpoB